MKTRRRTPLIAALAIILLFVVPVEASARVRQHGATSKPPTAQPRHPAERHNDRRTRPNRHPGRQAQTRRARRVVAPPVSRHAVTLTKAVATVHTRRELRLAVPCVPGRIVSAAVTPVAAHEKLMKIPYVPEKLSAMTGVAHPPDLDDIDDLPTSVPVPVVSVIRPATERPQLPDVQDVAATPAILPSLYDQRGHLVVPPPLRGSHEILVHQNEMADREGVTRVQDDDDLATMRRRAILVALPVSQGMQVDERLPANRRYCRTWTAQFLAAVARAHFARFHTPLQVNSAVRTVQVQQRLLRTNWNAAPAGGETASPHLTGQAVDLAKRGLSLSEIAWMRGYLLPLVQAGKIDVEEEFQQACFHISVYKTYLVGQAPPQTIAVTHRDSPAVAAIALQ